MKFKTLLLSGLLSLSTHAFAATEYTNGMFILNEDWFGHDPSSLNFYSYTDGTMHYNVYAQANDGTKLSESVGPTTQTATIFDGKIYFCQKGAPQGSVVVADAKTLKFIKRINIPTNNYAHFFCGVEGTHKAYVSTSGGIYTFNTLTDDFGPVVADTETEAYTDMVIKNGYLLAVNTGTGIAKVRIADDTYQLEMLDIPHPTSVFFVGNDAYASSNSATWGVPGPDAVEKIYKFDVAPMTVTETYTVDYAPQNTSFAYKHVTILTDTVNGDVTYAPAEGADFVSRFNVNTQTFTPKVITFEAPQKMYGNVVGRNSINGDIYAATFQDYGSQNYWFNVYSAEGTLKSSVKLNEHYWFPAMMFEALPSSENSSVADNLATSKLVRVFFTNLQGHTSEKPFEGLNIVTRVYADGHTAVTKEMR